MSACNFFPSQELTFETVQENKHRLQLALEPMSSGTFCIDLNEVERFDSAGLALFIEAKKACAAKQLKLLIRGMSPKMQALAEFCGVFNVLRCNVND